MVAGVLQGDTLAPQFIMQQPIHYASSAVLRTAIDPLDKHGFILKKRQSQRHRAIFITDADYADDLALLSNSFEEGIKLLHGMCKLTIVWQTC